MSRPSRVPSSKSDEALVCRSCGLTPAERGDQVSDLAIEYLCCRCLMAGPPKKPVAAGRAVRTPGPVPDGPQGDSAAVRTPGDTGIAPPTPIVAAAPVNGPSAAVRTPSRAAERRRQSREREIQEAGGIEAYRLAESERIRALRAKRNPPGATP